MLVKMSNKKVSEEACLSMYEQSVVHPIKNAVLTSLMIAQGS